MQFFLAVVDQLCDGEGGAAQTASKNVYSVGRRRFEAWREAIADGARAFSSLRHKYVFLDFLLLGCAQYHYH